MPEWLIQLIITLGANIIVWAIAIGKFMQRQKDSEDRLTKLEVKFDNRTMLPECLKVIAAKQLTEATTAGEIKAALASLNAKMELILHGIKININSGG